MDSRVRKRLRKWRNEVLDQLQRRTEDLPVFVVKGHAAVTRGRALLSYGAWMHGLCLRACWDHAPCRCWSGGTPGRFKGLSVA